jgi:hypothetical protein
MATANQFSRHGREDSNQIMIQRSSGESHQLKPSILYEDLGQIEIGIEPAGILTVFDFDTDTDFDPDVIHPFR